MQSVNQGFTPHIINGLVSHDVSGPPRRADVKKIVHSITIGELSWLIFVCLSWSEFPRFQNTSVGILGLQWSTFSEKMLDAACFSISGYWILELKMEHECCWKIFPSTELPEEKAPMLCWHCCVCGSIMNQVWTGWKKQEWTRELEGRRKLIEVAQLPNINPQPSRLLMSHT